MADAALLADLARAAPDHIVVAGDLTNLALPAEFAAAATWLAGLGEVERVSVVPGNHDATAPLPWTEGLSRWLPWMAHEDPPATAAASPARFPFLRRRGPVALIGLSSAVPTMPGSAAGMLGAAQIAALTALLRQTGREGRFRIVLLHHPPSVGPGGRRKALRDGAALRAALAAAGAELVLHGHHHRAMGATLPGPAGPIPVLGAPQALARGAHPPGWRLLGITRQREGWQLCSTLRLQDPATGAFAEARRETWRLGAAPPGAAPARGNVQ